MRINILYLTLILLFVALFLVAAKPTGDSATLKIKTRIIDCSTKEKAQHYCDKEDKCCQLVR